MALKINQTVVSKDGFTVPSGSIVKFQTIFPLDGTELHCNMEFYKDQAHVDAGGDKYFPSEMDTLGFVKTLDEAEYSALTPTVVHTHLKTHLETIYTAGTIDIVA